MTRKERSEASEMSILKEKSFRDTKSFVRMDNFEITAFSLDNVLDKALFAE